MGPVSLEVEDSIAVVTLDAPPLNIFNLDMRDGLIEALSAVRDVPDVRAMILRSAGNHFSAGADLSEFGTAASIHEARRIRWDRDPWALLWELPMPTIASLTGVAVGSGLEMALLCDLRIADKSTKLGLPETKLGMLPAAGGTQSLTKTVGPHQAAPIVALADTMDGEGALARRVISELVDDSDARAFELAATVAAMTPRAIRAVKRAVKSAMDHPLDVGLALEQRLSRSVAGLPHR